MKKKNFSKKLVLNKKTIANLPKENMDSIRGGSIPTVLDICFSRSLCTHLDCVSIVIECPIY